MNFTKARSVISINEICLEILSYIASKQHGTITRELLTTHYPNNSAHIASLSKGNRPNIYLDRERDVYQLTQRGYDTLITEGAPINEINAERATLPDYIRPANSGSVYRERTARRNASNAPSAVNMIEITIDRNEYVKITCKVHDGFKSWVKEHGALRNFKEDMGSDTARNWDASDDTKYYACNLSTIDQNSMGSANIIHNYGINSLILKLACASETNEYTVKYRGLVAWDVVNAHGSKLAESVVMFYKNFIKPFNLKIAVQYFI